MIVPLTTRFQQQCGAVTLFLYCSSLANAEASSNSVEILLKFGETFEYPDITDLSRIIMINIRDVTEAESLQSCIILEHFLTNPKDKYVTPHFG